MQLTMSEPKTAVQRHDALHRCTQCLHAALAGSSPPFATSFDASTAPLVELASTNWLPYPISPKGPLPLTYDSLAAAYA
jgi:hypothetical protein